MALNMYVHISTSVHTIDTYGCTHIATKGVYPLWLHIECPGKALLCFLVSPCVEIECPQEVKCGGIFFDGEGPIPHKRVREW